VNEVNSQLSVREIESGDIDDIIHYWLDADPEFMKSMGVDLSKMPTETQWRNLLSDQIQQSYPQKQSYCIIWCMEGKAIGHCNVNKIQYGVEAYMHVHLWFPEIRRKGLGIEFIKMTLPYFFNNLELQTLYCEPYALNPAPNKVLAKSGFSFLRSYNCIPGWINFQQDVHLWKMERQDLM
jgi:RimJ/RimL family protein N-acetyltransferase